MKDYPKCPNCGTKDYDVNQKENEGYCIASCGAVFSIDKNGKAKLKEERVAPVIVLP